MFVKFCYKQGKIMKETSEFVGSDVWWWSVKPVSSIWLVFLFTGDNDQGCLGDNYCPPKCTCTGTVVRCSRVRLQEIPRGIPPETSEL